MLLRQFRLGTPTYATIMGRARELPGGERGLRSRMKSVSRIEIRGNQDNQRHNRRMDEKIRRRPGIADEARRCAGRAKPHERSSEIEGIVHAAEEKPFAHQRQSPSHSAGARERPDSVMG